MSNKIKILCTGIVLWFLIFFFNSAEAAILKIVPNLKNIGVGQETIVDIKIDTEDVAINASQATLYFPPEILQVQDIEKNGSVFNFWVEEPVFSNDSGTVTFIGGTPKGVLGGALQAIKIKFKATGVGLANLSISDAAVTASDGKGTNVLESTQDTAIQVGKESAPVAPQPTTEQSPKSVPVVEQPQKVVRTAVPASRVPENPKIRIPLYPDETRWYNQIGEVTAFWELPPDITQVEAKISKSLSTVPGSPDSELFTGKNFGVLSEGIWYARVRFRNNVGWSKFVFYKISLDTGAPLPFEVFFDQGAPDNPSPKISYETSDGLSGISEFIIKIDNQEPIHTASSSLILPPQSPGKHLLTVRATDFAGNSTEDDLEFEILPIPSPQISYVSKNIFVGEGGIAIRGTGADGTSILIKIEDDGGRVVADAQTVVATNGNWETIIDQPLKKGIYKIKIIARDDRGATSLSVNSDPIKVRSRPIFTIGKFEVTPALFFVLFLIIVIGAFVSGVFFWRSEQGKVVRRVFIAERDTQGIVGGMKKDLEKLKKQLKATAGQENKTTVSMETNLLITRLEESVKKMEKYVIDDMEDIKKL